MHTVAKILMIGWSILCVLWVVLAIAGGMAAAHAEHQAHPEEVDQTASFGIAALIFGGGTAIASWVGGMVPLAIIYFCTRPAIDVNVRSLPRRSSPARRRYR